MLALKALCVLLWALTAAPALAQITTPVGSPTQVVPAPITSSVPVPDPTVLTTQASEKAVAALKELIEARIKAVEEEIEILRESALGGPDRVSARLDGLQELVETQILALKELVAQQFIGVDQNFEGRDTALAAALLAQKTAVDEQNRANALSIAKSDAATTKQIDTIGTSIGTVTSAINEKVDDLRNRVQAIESRAVGSGENRAESSSNWVWGFGALAAVATIISIFGTIIALVNRAAPAPIPVAVYNGNGPGPSHSTGRK